MSNFYSPLRYPGGKTRIFDFVSSLIIENNLVGINYAEPYAGGSGLALKLLFNEYVNTIYINDLDDSIYGFWYSILSRPEEFCDWINKVEVNIKSWNYYKKIQSNPEYYDKFELAKSTFFLNRTNISGVIKGGPIGGIKQEGKYKIDARFNRTSLVTRVLKIAKFKDRIRISNQDGINFIKRIDKLEEDAFIYLDPPYYEKAADLYMNYFQEKDHKRLSKFVRSMKKRWLISYDYHDFIISLYEEKEKFLYKLSQSASNRVGDEILIFSDRLDFENSINKLNTPLAL